MMRARTALALAAILTGMTASALTQTMAATALPSIGRDLGGLDRISWVIGAYLLASTVTLPLFARLSDLAGRRVLYVAGLAAFVAGALLVGIAPGMEWLIAARALQGAGAGAVAPAALAAIGDLFDDRRRGRVFGVIGVVQVLANLAGPPLGGWITDNWSWRWGFLLIAPLGVLALGLAAFSLGGHRAVQAPAGRVDWPGALLFGAGLGSALIGLQGLGGGDPAGGALLAVPGLLLIAAAVRHEARQVDPVIPLAMLREPALASAAIGTLLVGAASNGAVAYLPLWLQSVGGLSATASGVALAPMLLAVGIGSAAGGALANRAARVVPAAAWALVLAGFAALSLGSGAWLAPAVTAIGAGLGVLVPVYLLRAQAAGGEAQRGTASGLIQLARNTGGAAGVSLLALWTGAYGIAGAAFVAIFASLAGCAALGLWLNAAVRSPRTAEGNDL